MIKIVNTSVNSLFTINESCDFLEISPNEYIVTFEGKKYTILLIGQMNHHIELLINGQHFEYRIEDLGDTLIKKLGLKDQRSSSETALKSPMPGLIKDIFIKKGDELKKDDPILILEAMKMENTLRCPKDGLIVKDVKISIGQSVEKNICLVQF
jgi:acetyl/propionyl-CoA carboxylase alpha subunit